MPVVVAQWEQGWGWERALALNQTLNEQKSKVLC